MYKIYVNDTLLEFAETAALQGHHVIQPDEIIVSYPGKAKFLFNYIDLAEKSKRFRRIVIHHHDKKELRQAIKAQFKTERAAGGLVLNPKKEALLIFRRGFWDLPKGKIDEGEKKKQAALREVAEETGVEEVTIEKRLAVTYHMYRNQLRRRILKKTFWYLMHTKQDTLQPQADEGITHAGWYTIDDFLQSNPKIHHNIRDVLQRFRSGE